MNRPMFRVMALASLVALAGCHRQAEAPGDAPTGLTVTPGDGRVTVSWDQQPGLTYWIFFQQGSTVTAAATGVPLIFGAQSPQIVSNLPNGFRFAFVMNATTNDSKAGPSSAVVTEVPRLAGEKWTPGRPLAPQNLNGLAFGLVAVSGISTARLVAVGDLGGIFSGDYNYTNADPPGVTAWTQAPVPDGFTKNLAAVIYTGGFVALGADGSILTSPDGNTWTSGASIPSNGTGMNGITLGVASNALVYVAVGAAGKIFTSPDPTTPWTPATSNTGNDLFSVSYISATGTFIATGANGTLLTSTDTIDWKPQSPNPPTSNALRGAAFGVGSTAAGATYVVVGDAGTILTSDTGTDWSLTTLPSLQNLRGVTFGSRFVAVGQGDKVVHSDNAIDWPPEPPALSGTADLAAVIFAPAMYVAVGAAGANTVSK